MRKEIIEEAIKKRSLEYRVLHGYKKTGKKLKNSHANEKCFIVGNGPSLNSSDLNMIKNEVSFAANSIFRIYSQTEWRPTYYCIQDAKVINELKSEEVSSAYLESDFFFVASSLYRMCHEKGLLSKKVLSFPIIQADMECNTIPFSDDIIRGFFNGYTVTYMAMQIAVYMGFRSIILLGVDHSFPYIKDEKGMVIVNDLSIPGHFYETPADNLDLNKRPSANYHEYVTKAYQSAEEYSRKTNRFRIYNATRGGCLEVFERVNLEDII